MTNICSKPCVDKSILSRTYINKCQNDIVFIQNLCKNYIIHIKKKSLNFYIIIIIINNKYSVLNI